jgi:hypothetical protein
MQITKNSTRLIIEHEVIKREKKFCIISERGLESRVLQMK